MATEIENPTSLPTAAEPQATTPEADQRPRLESVLGPQWEFGWQNVAVAVWFGLFFMYLSYQSLFHTDLWGHVAYGKWMLEHSALPAEDPFVQYCQGVPAICSAWLGQVLFGLVERAGGAEAISHLFAVTVLLTYMTLAGAFYWRTRQLGTAMLAMWIGFFLVWSRHGTVRTEMFATLSYAVLFLVFAIVDRRRDLVADQGQPHAEPHLGWGLIASLGAIVLLNGIFWGNVHGSCLVGVLVLGTRVVGRVIDLAFQKRDAMSMLLDREAHLWLFLTEMACVAAVINPYGMNGVLNALEFGKNLNLPDVLEWKSLLLTDLEGMQMLASWLLMGVLFRFSPRRIRAWEMLVLAGLSWATIKNVRMIGWYGFVFAYVLLPHLAWVGRRVWNWVLANPLLQDDLTWKKLQQRSHMHFIGCIFVGWVAFALSHAANPLLGGVSRKPEQLYSKETPRGVSEFLRKHPPSKPIFNPQWWGDWLAWDGPQGLPVFMTTNAVHLAPHRYWQDYLGIARAQANWQNQLKKYNVETMIVHKTDMPQLDVQVRNLAGWTFVYEDKLAVIMSKDPVLLESFRAAQAQAAAEAKLKPAPAVTAETTETAPPEAEPADAEAAE